MEDPRDSISQEARDAAVSLFKQEARMVASFLIDGGGGQLPRVTDLRDNPAGHCAMDAMARVWKDLKDARLDLMFERSRIWRENRRANTAEKKLAKLRQEAKGMRAALKQAALDTHARPK